MNQQPLKYWFESALSLPAAERAPWLASECTDAAMRKKVVALLAADADAETDAAEVPAIERVHRVSDPAPPSLDADRFIGQRIGGFRLQRLIGQGGMAAVFLAERAEADFTQRAAVKLLQRGMFSALEQRLFRRERQALAMLSHPNIAQLIDGGVTASGIAYLAMEYIDGERLTQYVNAHRLDVTARLRLFVTVCRAVDAAHHALIVHRDIKPANILVTAEGIVKLLDFGIAKLLEHDRETPTQTGLAPLTPEYAAPEQFDGRPITTATDVYALGVLLHELLLGERPSHDAQSLPSQRVAALHSDPATLPLPPTQLRRQLKGDLDNIISKASESEPALRYANAGVLADDIERHLQGLPVQAHPPSGWYRTRKFVRRHRGAVAICLLLTIGMLASLLVALSQAHVARKEAARANAVRDFLIGALDAGRAKLPRDQRPTLGDLVTAAHSKVDADPALDAQTRAEVLSTLAEVSWSAGNLEEAQTLFKSAMAQREAVAGIDDRRSLGIRARFTELLIDQDAYIEAQALIDAIPTIAYTRIDAVSMEIGVSRAIVRQANGKVESALADLPRLLELAQLLYDSDSEHALEARIAIGDIYAAAHRSEAARQLLAPALAQWRERGLPESSFIARAMRNLAVALTDAGDRASSHAIMRETLALQRRIYPADHPEIAFTMTSLAIGLAQDELFDESRDLQEQALAMLQNRAGEDSVDLVLPRLGLAFIERSQRNFDSALVHLHEAMRICRIDANLLHPPCANAYFNFADVLYQRNRFDEAEHAAQEALELAEQKGQHVYVGMLWVLLANIASGTKEYELSLERAQKALAIIKADTNSRPETLQLARLAHAESLIGLRRYQEAFDEVALSIPEWTKINLAPKFRLLSFLAVRAEAELGLGDLAAARASAKQALALGVDPKLIKPQTLDFLRATASN
jgi:eukaryotic-like serine/threonine-protein kinase